MLRDSESLARHVERWFERREDGVARRALAVEPLLGDVSPRRYLRVRFASPPRSTIVAFHPPAASDVAERFVRTNALLAAAGVRVPEILGRDEAAGLLELEDLGDRTLYDFEGQEDAAIEAWTESALAALVALRSIPLERAEALNPPLDAAVFRRELEQTRRLLFEPFGAGESGATDRGAARAFAEALEAMVVRLEAQPAVACHRDFMARNLVPLPAGQVAVLDHQDLRRGPAAYDLASWLNDSLFAGPRREAASCRRFEALGITEEHYRRAVCQRGLKVAGTFLAFAEKGSRRHLRLLRPSVDRAVGAMPALPEMAAVAPWVAAWWRGCSATLPF